MIRPATLEDSKAVIELMYTAIGSIAHTLAGSDDVDETLQILEAFFKQQGNRLSYDKVIVKEEEGEVIAFILAYHGSEAASLDAPFVEHLKARGMTNPIIVTEAREDEYYLDSLAVHSNYQGQGIGTEMLTVFEHRAQELGHTQIMLLVDEENTSAKRLYKKLGYTEDGMLQLSGHQFHRMIKQL